MLTKLKWKAASVFFGVHAGLFLGLYGVFKLQESADRFHPAFPWVLSSVIAAYCSFWLACLFVYAPLAPWITRVRTLMNWRQWVLSELPTLIALVPIVIKLIQAWRSSHPQGASFPSDVRDLSQWLSKTLEAELPPHPHVRAIHLRSRKPRAATRKARKTA